MNKYNYQINDEKIKNFGGQYPASIQYESEVMKVLLLAECACELWYFENNFTENKSANVKIFYGEDLIGIHQVTAQVNVNFCAD